MNLDRLSLLIGEENINKIKNTNILLVGIGGVGGYTLETLVRSGIENITIIDYDIVDVTNLNRQILTDTTNIGEYKVDIAHNRYININPNININRLKIKLTSDNFNLINIKDYDYVIDACDTISTKELLINECINNNVKIISSMGTAKKMDASKLSITTLDKTSYDKIAKLLRKRIDKKIQKKVVVVNSNEEVINTTLGSNSFVPSVAGILITSYIINDIVKKNKNTI